MPMTDKVIKVKPEIFEEMASFSFFFFFMFDLAFGVITIKDIVMTLIPVKIF